MKKASDKPNNVKSDPEKMQYIILKKFPYTFIWQKCMIKLPSKNIIFSLPIFVKVSNIAFVDYINSSMKDGVIESLFRKTNGCYAWNTWVRNDDNNSMIVVAQINASLTDMVINHIENLPNKVSALYGAEKKEEYLRERAAYWPSICKEMSN